MSVKDLIVFFSTNGSDLLTLTMTNLFFCFTLTLKNIWRNTLGLLLILLTCLVLLCFSVNFPTKRNLPPSQLKSILTCKAVVCLSSVSPGVFIVHSSAIVLSKTWNCLASSSLPPTQWPFSHVNTFCWHANVKWKLLLLFALLCLWCDLQIKEDDGEWLEVLFCVWFFQLFFSDPSFQPALSKIFWQMCGFDICSRQVPSW